MEGKPKDNCKKCKGTGVVKLSKFKKWWLNFYYGTPKEYLDKLRCDCIWK